MKKYIWLIGLILILFYIIYAFNVYFARSIKEIHYLPNDFIGNVLIIFNQDNGHKKEKRKGWRIYEVPNNGILITQYKSNPGWLEKADDLLFYYVDSMQMPIKSIPYIFNISYDSIANRSDLGVYYMYYTNLEINGVKVHYKSYIIDTLNLIRKKYPLDQNDLPRIEKALSAIN